MADARTTAAASRALDRIGRDVTLLNYFEDSADDYGGNYSETAGSPYTVKARVDRPSAGEPVRDAFGNDVEVDVEIFIEAGTSAANGVVDGGGEGATQVDVDGQTYVVVVADNQDNGLLRLQATRKN